ncbi:MAG: cyclic peptide export ABC transporter [Candidatus Aminicenantes bacterium]|nr:cyclic peptide export ABC transporter [Candidatus Aminicenantes bacterium]NIM79887.1 cyclic peptide export ABC transporter [Candidatus Aminicenantes bacterium]NIN19224.1 cyclic peptide export ABC transporter [Candidatus Aminicenantes bacterium]NIN43129.1 cyclic peptide export ABC transporter [Candidatus Aminicenantes bacterium]NIN85866.1 cyclic peptide export ABC transporter [Candidatus Aminicenantes bacterium]
MKTRIKGYRKFGILVLFVCMGMSFFTHPLRIEAQQTETLITEIEERVQELMEKGNIPGLALVMLRPGRPDYIKGFGYADLEKEIPVTADTLFEIGSCTKAFTALAALQLEKEGLLNLDDPVSKYLPWFKPTYKKKHYEITLRQFLHQTSGIPENSVRYIPMGDEENALEQTVRTIKDIKLESVPGKEYKYATINYDVIGRIIEVVTRMSYEDYMTKHVIQPLGLTNTFVGKPGVDPELSEKVAAGYKAGFFAPRKYNAPAYRGNYPAGYIVSNGKDIAKWLKLQMGLEESPLTPLIQKSHQRDETVSPGGDMSSYAMGWQVSLSGNGLIFHGGWNPNYVSHFMFSPRSKTAVAVLTNSDSLSHVPFITNLVMNRVQGIKPEREYEPPGGMDKSYSIVSIILFLYLIIVAGFIISVVIGLIKKKRQFEPLTLKMAGKILLGIPILAPFIIGIYLLPTAIRGVNWKTAVVWAPVSFKTAAILLVAAFVASYLGYILLLLFPHKNKYLRSIPMLIVLSVLSGIANAVVIFLITGSLVTPEERLLYMVYYFGLAMLLYILGRKVIQTKLTKITFDIVYDMRMNLLEKVFYTSYQRFEKLDRGRVFATINDDTGQIGNSANIFVTMLTSLITILGCFLFLATIAFWATIVTIGVILCITVLYYIVSQKAQVYMEEARDTRDVFMRLLNGLIDGFKELSIHFNKKREYRDDLEKTTDEFRNKTVVAMVKFINAFMIGESMLIAILGAVGFAVPKLFPQIQTFTLISFIMILLYLIGPITGILATIPQVMQIGVAWRRVKEFIKDIPANLDPEEMEKLELNVKHVDHIEAKGVTFQYESENEEDEAFSVGPVDFDAKKGEVVFIIGGNGSGKTTLAKLLTGLYIPHEGSIHVDGKDVNNYQLGEYFSTVFSGYHLFEKLYNIDLSDEEKRKEGDEYLKTLRLDDKVNFEADSLSTIDLSGGQRKRLALLQCYLEDCPIYLFDEVAADQDPEFRKFFYRELLKRMKEKGKIVIAITHDDHYFDVADKVIKMDMGKIDVITEGKTQLMLTS